MLSNASPSFRISKSIRGFTQSRQFLSPHSLFLNSRTARLQRLKKIRTTRPNSSPSLIKVLSTFSANERSPFLPTKYKAGHENLAIKPNQVRWRPPILKAQIRAQLCKQAFNWRILHYLFKIPINHSTKSLKTSHQSIKPQLNQQTDDPFKKSIKVLAKLPPNFYDGSLTLQEYNAIKRDPVPKLVKLFGGLNRLTTKDKRLLGLSIPNDLSTISRPLNNKQKAQDDLKNEKLEGLPSSSNLKLVPGRFGPYSGRRKPFKGKMRERNRLSKIQDVKEKMIKMDERVKSYRSEWKANKEKSKPALPF